MMLLKNQIWKKMQEENQVSKERWRKILKTTRTVHWGPLQQHNNHLQERHQMLITSNKIRTPYYNTALPLILTPHILSLHRVQQIAEPPYCDIPTLYWVP